VVDKVVDMEILQEYLELLEVLAVVVVLTNLVIQHLVEQVILLLQVHHKVMLEDQVQELRAQVAVVEQQLQEEMEVHPLVELEVQEHQTQLQEVQ
tara:strand:+ start:243 stop:527 length:285 start_codon:yes stop_codon:yes gene_type:complete